MRRPVKVDISELSVTGFDWTRVDALANALRSELSRLIRLQGSGADAGTQPAEAAPDPTGAAASVGRVVGQAIYRRLPR